MNGVELPLDVSDGSVEATCNPLQSINVGWIVLIWRGPSVPFLYGEVWVASKSGYIGILDFAIALIAGVDRVH